MRMGLPVAAGTTVSIDVHIAGAARPVATELPAAVAGLPWPDDVAWPADASLAAGLLPAMRRGETLVVDGPVSPRLLAGAARVQDVFLTWDRALRPTRPWYRRVAIEAGPPREGVRWTAARPNGAARTASFFTGGVDSFFTAQRHRASLSALVYVEGFDVPLDAAGLRATVRARLVAAAERFGLPLVVVASDLRALGTACEVGWPDQHGSALAAIAHLLAPWFERVLVPSTHTYAHLEGLGSHPLLDPLWSSERLAIEHDGAEATRVDKLRAIVDEPAAREHLRVCWENRDGAYNCGTCEKCVRTAAAMRAAGVLERFATLPAPSIRQIGATRATGRGSAWEDVRNDLQRTGADPELHRAVCRVLARHERRRTRELRARYRP